MRIWLLLLALAAVLAALAIAGVEALIYEEACRANATLAGGIFSIPLAAAIRI